MRCSLSRAGKIDTKFVLTHLLLLCIEKIMGDRPAAGLRTLTPSTQVRILVSQPLIKKGFTTFHSVSPFLVLRFYPTPAPLFFCFSSNKNRHKQKEGLHNGQPCILSLFVFVQGRRCSVAGACHRL